MPRISHGLPIISRSAVLLLACWSLTACSNEPVPEKAVQSAQGFSDVADVMVAVGQPAPEFSLPDAQGEIVNLADFRGQSGVMLVFFRGAWCPFCMSHLDDLQAVFPSLAEYQVQLLAISPEDIEGAAGLAEKFDAPYIFLSDTDLAVTQRYGIRSDKDLPHPAVILLDKTGKVVWFYISENYKQRPSSAQVLEVLAREFK